MSYDLAIHLDAEREWAKLDARVKRRFKENLSKERLVSPPVAKDTLRDLPDCYKIKVTTPQFRLIYCVDHEAKRLTIFPWRCAKMFGGIEESAPAWLVPPHWALRARIHRAGQSSASPISPSGLTQPANLRQMESALDNCSYHPAQCPPVIAPCTRIDPAQTGSSRRDARAQHTKEHGHVRHLSSSYGRLE